MLAPSGSRALLMFAAIAISCIPKERLDEEHDGATSAHVGESLQTVALASSGVVEEKARDGAIRLGRAVSDSDPLLTQVFVDRFDRQELGTDWRTRSDAWRIDSGRLCVKGAHNRPAWLARRLPVNARIEFDATSQSTDGDIKAEMWGDGLSAAKAATYDDATSYLVIFGGWKNRFHVLARLNEHGNDRAELVVDPKGTDSRTSPVVANRTYHMRVERLDGHTIRWLVDDVEVAVLDDQAPLVGLAHDHVGFNDWETPVCFDNLTITPF